MKKKSQFFAALLAALMLCCACSAGANVNPRESGTTVSNTITAVPMAQQGDRSGFSDVAPGAWYEDAANWCREQGILDGDTFSPDTEMTRATVAEALYRSEGSPEVSAANFPDIPAGSAFADAAAWASANGVMSGYSSGLFGADDPVTRDQMAAILWRYAGEPSVEAGQDFADEASIAGFARTAVDWARANSVINGKDGNRFDPKGPLTRAQTAAILYRYLTGSESASASGNAPVVYI